MTDSSASTFEDDLVDHLRTHGGAVTEGPLKGHPLLIMTSEGARSGDPRRAILTWSRDDGDFVVAATAGGSKTDPAWLHNLRRHPDVTIEVDGESLDATATVVEEGPERDRLWDRHVAALPWFAEYPAQTARVIPMVRLTPRR